MKMKLKMIIENLKISFDKINKVKDVFYKWAEEECKYE